VSPSLSLPFSPSSSPPSLSLWFCAVTDIAHPYCRLISGFLQFRKDADDCCSRYLKLSRKQRLYAFAYCLLAGFALSILV
jgi:hypothetical protein